MSRFIEPAPLAACVPPLTSALLSQLWLLNSDSITASVAQVRDGGESSVSSATRALKVLYTACSDAGSQQRE